MNLKYLLAPAMILFSLPAAAQWTDLLADKTLAGWESIGDGSWTLSREKILTGQKNISQKGENQAWFYTKKEYANFDLEFDWWLRLGGNSGVSIRDTSRAKWAITGNWDAQKTPSHIGYEIQLSNGYKDQYLSGSVYNFDKAPEVITEPNDWNHMKIESRKDGITVFINGKQVSHYAGDPARSLTGPIGLQLHDRNTVVMFRNLKIHELR
jgi:hypothetical protein